MFVILVGLLMGANTLLKTGNEVSSLSIQLLYIKLHLGVVILACQLRYNAYY